MKKFSRGSNNLKPSDELENLCHYSKNNLLEKGNLRLVV